jgi:hypothetical protein
LKGVLGKRGNRELLAKLFVKRKKVGNCLRIIEKDKILN